MPQNAISEILSNVNNAGLAWDLTRTGSWCRRGLVWTPPMGTALKLNTDGACSGDPKNFAIGGLCRDAGELWVFGFYQRLGCTRALSTELWAIWQGL